MRRFAMIVGIAMLLGGCANERPMGPLGYQTGGLTSPAYAANRDVAASLEQDIESRRVAQKSMAAKVLAAIALERVTGLKPDPARLVSSN